VSLHGILEQLDIMLIRISSLAAWQNLCPAWGNKHEFEDDSLAPARKITVENSRVANA
jgi:hypothetical protein